MCVRPALVMLMILATGEVAPAQVRPAGMHQAPPADSTTLAGPMSVFLYSAAMPGSGQRELGLRRWVPYLALEAVGWVRYLDRRSAGHVLEMEYRDLAWDVARRISVGERRDGDFDYYEALGKYAASGSFDSDPGRTGVQPERLEGTYNGSVWQLAREIFFPADVDSLPESAPEYRQALDYYQRHAVGPELSWSWSGNAEAQERYRDTMHASDEALRSATRTLGLILANHLVSAIDALVSARLTGSDNSAAPVNIESTVNRRRGGDPSWSAVVRVRWPRR